MTQVFSERLALLLGKQKEHIAREGIPTREIRIDRMARGVRLLSENREEIVAAISADYGGRSRHETLLIEIFAGIAAFGYAIENVGAWMEPRAYPALVPDAEARVERVPLGVVGIVGPWNFPFTLTLMPLAGVLAAGNRAIIKPSELTPASSDLLTRLVPRYFSEDEVAVVTGGPEDGEIFASEKFDHLIFTGSPGVATHVMRAAAQNLTPLTLELGGKSAVVVTDQFDLAEAAARTMAVKLRNAGQICLAPDYAYIPRGKSAAFADACIAAARRMYPDGLSSTDYTSIINDRHFGRINAIVQDASVKGAQIIDVFQTGQTNGRKFPPVVILSPTDDMAALRDEIFGPVLPVVEYDDLAQVSERMSALPPGLALYYFGEDDDRGRRFIASTKAGGVTINDVMTHALAESLPFGGVGASGMGAYHGEQGFTTFSQSKTIYRQSKDQAVVELFRPPYGAAFEAFLSGSL